MNRSRPARQRPQYAPEVMETIAIMVEVMVSQHARHLREKQAARTSDTTR